jgi:NADH-quinone oxidoreductase subunit L
VKTDKMPVWQKSSRIINIMWMRFTMLVIRKPLDAISSVFYKFMDLQIVDGIVNGVGSAVTGIGSAVRLLQTGNIGFYIVSMVMGVVLILLFTFII